MLSFPWGEFSVELRENTGCFTILKHKKKKSGHFAGQKTMNFEENITFTLPEPEVHGPSLRPAPPSFRNRTKGAKKSPVNCQTSELEHCLLLLAFFQLIAMLLL
ncbi:serine threonine-protein kinase [Musa troglodytarum]|uniref:Serine threonine-protein kinase n=1 Tax=Musa troglodytarum TaxID=320322 RepID=A0A9E7JVN5_9LILI|nr:serine threonine-protein kinase [Musa troglodytarum]